MFQANWATLTNPTQQANLGDFLPLAWGTDTPGSTVRKFRYQQPWPSFPPFHAAVKVGQGDRVSSTDFVDCSKSQFYKFTAQS